jgi:hypothetical protein
MLAGDDFDPQSSERPFIFRRRVGSVAGCPFRLATPLENADAERAEILEWLWAGADPA